MSAQAKTEAQVVKTEVRASQYQQQMQDTKQLQMELTFVCQKQLDSEP
jgi:hypothetical protein